MIMCTPACLIIKESDKTDDGIYQGRSQPPLLLGSYVLRNGVNSSGNE
jgi:hypothetical protein